MEHGRSDRPAEASRGTDAERFQRMADALPVMIWTSGPDQLFTWFNQSWLTFTGRSLENETGLGWSEGVHPQDRRRYLETYEHAFASRQPFQMEYRLRRQFGYQWALTIFEVCVIVVLFLIFAFGPERKGRDFHAS